MNPQDNYWFYLSYSRRDAEGNKFISRFHADLAQEIASLAGLTSKPGQIGFFDDRSIDVGDAWPRKQAEALASTRTLICIYSPNYFQSDMCGREFQVFLSRLKEYAPDMSKQGLPPLIFPVLWDSPKKLPRTLPPVVQSIQYAREDLGSTYAANGLNHIMRLGKEDEYRKVVDSFASLIYKRVVEFSLVPMQDLPAPSKVESAFRLDKAPPASIESPTESAPRNSPFSPLVRVIIRRAQDLARRTASESVTTSCLLFAISDIGRRAAGDGTPRFLQQQFAAIPVEKYESVYESFIPSSRKIPDEPLPDKRASKDVWTTPRSENAANVFDKAKEFSELTPKDGKIHERHLLAALLMHSPDAKQTGAQQRLQELGCELLPLRQAFLEELIKIDCIGAGKGKDSLPLWRFILFPEQAAVRMSGFNSDVYTDEDLLGIDKDVDAFATLIAARTVTPPLSIGIFGDWGSGKSFFMRRLMKRVDEVTLKAREAGKPQNELGIYKRVAQIEFNAWHYVEGNLWASLVENIFQNLKISQSEENDEIAVIKRRDALLDTLKVEEAAKAKVEAQAQEAKEKLEQKDKEIKDVADAHKDKADKLAQLSEKEALALVQLSIELDEQAKGELNGVLQLAGVSMVGDAARDFQSALSEARSVYERGNTLLTPMLKAPDGGKRFRWLLAVLLAGPVVGLVARYIFKRYSVELGNLSGYLTGVTTLMTMGALWIKQQAAWTSERLKKTEEIKLKVDKEAEEKMAHLRADNAKEMATYTQELELLKAQYAALLSERAEVQKRVEQIDDELKQTSAVQMLAKFIQDRAASDDYRKYLGLLALIRRDFLSLSNLIEKGNEELSRKLKEGKVEEVVAPVNRIVLYIDDLDRCPPHKVIAVLQAVHLLLAFPLFVVVVGVDGRWVAQSLKKGYPGLLSEGERSAVKRNSPEVVGENATPHDYLEKIFQIPFWLNPLEAGSTTKMLRKLMPVTKSNGTSGGGTKEKQNGSATTDNKGDSSKITDQIGEKDSTIDEQAADERQESLDHKDATHETRADHVAESQQSEQEQNGRGKIHREIDLNPDSLDIVKSELDFVEALTPLLGRSPRAVKRFINIYRLVKVGLEPVEAASFLDETVALAQFKVVMFLLSIATGMPEISRAVFQTLMRVDEDRRRERDDKIIRDVGLDFDWLTTTARGQIESSPHSNWSCLQEWLSGYKEGEWLKMDIGAAAAWSNRIARYSFNIRQGMS